MWFSGIQRPRRRLPMLAIVVDSFLQGEPTYDCIQQITKHSAQRGID